MPSCLTLGSPVLMRMKLPSSFPRLKGFRFPREIVAYAVWAYHRFAPSTADVEDLLTERGVIVSRDTVRLWSNRFGGHFAHCIRKERPRTNDTRRMDEVVIPIGGQKFWLWRAIDANGDVLNILVQARRNSKAAKRFFSRLVRQFGQSRRSFFAVFHARHRVITRAAYCNSRSKLLSAPTACSMKCFAISGNSGFAGNAKAKW